MPILPETAALTGFYQIGLAMVALTLGGRLILRGQNGIALQFITGWGAFCLVVTAWGMVLPFSLRIPMVGFLAAGLGGVFVGRPQTGRADLREAGRLLVLALPLLLVMADVAPSQSDNLAVMMPNTAYIFDYGHFPVQDGPPIYTDVPVAPYNTHLVSLLGSLAGGGYAPNSPSLLTVFLHLPAGLLLAAILAGGARPGWRHTAGGLALATVLNPGFVPRVSFSGYGEAPLAIALLFSGWLALRVIEQLAEGRRWPPLLVPLALALVCLINIKQQGIGLVAAFLGGLALTVLTDRRIGWRDGARILVAAALPAIALYLSWRGYVLVKFPAGELKPLPVSQWVWAELPKILRDTGAVILRHPVYFSLIGLAAAVLALRPRGLGEPSRRALVLTLAAILLYNLFVLLTFVGHFRAEHSYFRYNSHQSLLLLLALVLAGRDLLAARWNPGPRLVAAGGAVMIAIIVVAPLATAPLLRFDRDMPQPWLRDLAAKLGEEIQPTDAVALILPGDNASVRDAMSSLLRFAPVRRPLLRIGAYTAADLAQVAEDGYGIALLSCTDGTGLGLPDKAAALLRRDEHGWRVDKTWPYPAPPRKTWWNWTGFIAAEPFCLK